MKDTTQRQVYCCQCEATVNAEVMSGKRIYGHRTDLHHLRFWVCPTCKNYVGLHAGRDAPKGTIPFPRLRKARQEIHKVIDELWLGKYMSRTQVYKRMAVVVGCKEFHVAEVNTIEEAKRVYRLAVEFVNQTKESHARSQENPGLKPTPAAQGTQADDQGR